MRFVKCKRFMEFPFGNDIAFKDLKVSRSGIDHVS